MPPKLARKMDHALAEQCRKLVFKTAKKYDVPPAFIVGHIRSVSVDAARYEVWRVMLLNFHMTRTQIAEIFGRDRRRLRRSVLGV